MFQLTFFVLLSRYSTPAYGDGYVYSESAIIIAIIIALTPIVGMVGIAIKEVINTRGGLKEVGIKLFAMEQYLACISLGLLK